jgi:beta-lactamase regulating signal transducer with metallopeptidase domain
VTLLEGMFTYPLLRALGWALLHFLWQGALVALLLAGVLSLLRERATNIRYAAACAALGLMLLLPAATFLRQSSSSQGAEVDEMSLQSPPKSEVISVSGRIGGSERRPNEASAGMRSPIRQRPLTARLDPLLPWLISAWLLGVLGLTVRVLGGLMYARRLTRCENRLIGIHWQERLRHLSKKLRLKQSVLLLESQLVRVPTTVGWLRPVILLPASALTGLTPQQLESVLAHELAHIRRHDYLVNLFQVVVETLLFYHPAVWWVSGQVRIEREHACDDSAVAVCGDPVAYARALTRMERLRRDTPLLAVNADGGKLKGRIRRLIENTQGSRSSSSLLMGLLFVAAFFTSLACAHSVLSQKRQSAAVAEARESPPRESVYRDSSPRQAATEDRRAPVDEVASLIAGDDTAGEDEETRRVVLTALGGRAGTVIVMDPRTGRVYTVVNQEWAIRRSWKPASMIKLVTGVAGVGDKAIEASGRVRVSARAKALDLTEALARSDNSYFSHLGESVGAERLISYAHEFGIGELTGINYAGESAGSLPPFFTGSDASRIGAFGDGIETTPIQLATLVSAIANGGALVVPRVPRTPQEGSQFEPQVRRRLRIPRENIERLIPGMIAAVKYGTAKGASDRTQRVAGKTGTFIDDESPVGIFASYAPADDPRLVVVVVTRGRNESGPIAASVAGAIYRALNRRS